MYITVTVMMAAVKLTEAKEDKMSYEPFLIY
jgi:hypothetical protein